MKSSGNIFWIIVLQYLSLKNSVYILISTEETSLWNTLKLKQKKPQMWTYHAVQYLGESAHEYFVTKWCNRHEAQQLRYTR